MFFNLAAIPEDMCECLGVFCLLVGFVLFSFLCVNECVCVFICLLLFVILLCEVHYLNEQLTLSGESSASMGSTPFCGLCTHKYTGVSGKGPYFPIGLNLC